MRNIFIAKNNLSCPKIRPISISTWLFSIKALEQNNGYKYKGTEQLLNLTWLLITFNKEKQLVAASPAGEQSSRIETALQKAIKKASGFMHAL